MENISLNDVLNNIDDKENKYEVSLMNYNLETHISSF